MSTRIASAALYGAPAPDVRVSPDWVNGVTAFLDSKIPLRECSFHDASGRRVGPGPFETLRDDILRTAASGLLTKLSLYAHPNKTRGLMGSWQASGWASLPKNNVLYLGLTESAGVSPGELMRVLYASSRSMGRRAYGIGYFYPWDRGPDLFAIGILGHTGPISARSERPEDSDSHQDRVGQWLNEMGGPKRYLSGWFRDVYPANALSERHVTAVVNGKPLLHSGIGTFSQLGDGLWLWEVPEADIPDARELIRAAGLLICT